MRQLQDLFIFIGLDQDKIRQNKKRVSAKTTKKHEGGEGVLLAYIKPITFFYQKSKYLSRSYKILLESYTTLLLLLWRASGGQGFQMQLY